MLVKSKYMNVLFAHDEPDDGQMSSDFCRSVAAEA